MKQVTKKISFFSLLLFSFLQVTESAIINVPDGATSISAALSSVNKGDTVVVAPGYYREHLFIPASVVLLSKSTFKAVIDGNGRGTIITMGTSSTICGFEIKNGTIGVFSTSSNSTITQCRIVFNQQSGIMCVGNLPRIEDNIIAYNRGSGVQGWDVRSTSASINHNTIAFNSNHGISLGGNSSIIVENNIIAFNNQFGLKPSSEAVRVLMLNNSIFQNEQFSNVLPSDNFSFDPLFKDPVHLDFSLNKESRCIGRSTDNQDLGARLVY
ncbi:MAG TPA: right-handed parallel beta-helix repeat-containing protein [Chitinispirillaceae bacterium]|nr:right-handed parallel beta-helix repeat-containing protein [Chitinispirillaceae bacterium]